MKARLRFIEVPGTFQGLDKQPWQFELQIVTRGGPLHGMRITPGNVIYLTPEKALSAARRVAKQLNLTVEE